MEPETGGVGRARRFAGGALLCTGLLAAWLQGTPAGSDSGRSAALPVPSAEPASSETGSPSPELSATDEAARDELSAELGRILDRIRWRSARWSVLAVSLDRGDTLFARNLRTPLAPASNAKLLTSAAALHYLGPDFRFQTFVLAEALPDEEGALHGDIVLYGTGDPSISDRLYPDKTTVLDSLARELAERGIRRIDGAVVGDGSFFPDSMLPPGWEQSDLNDWFAAPVSALSYNENVATLRIEPGPFPGIRPLVHTIPDHAPLHFLNEASTVSPRSRAWPPLMVDRPDPREPIRVLGEMRVGGREAWRVITVDDPALFAADAFRKALERAGIAVRDGARSLALGERSRLSERTLFAPGLRSEPDLRILARHRSPELRELLEVLNKQSHNLYAEVVLKTVGKVARNEATRTGGVRAVESYLRDEAGVADSQFRLVDGSGLSPNNRVSASAFVSVMEHAARQPWAGDFFRALPEAGNRRELRRMYRTYAARNLRAKTGTIEHVSALSGLVRSRTGERILFSILSNDVPSTSAAKGVEDRIGARLAAFDRPFDPATEGRNAPPETPTDEGFTGRHRVRAGESFSTIASRYGVPVEALLSANPGVTPRRLRVGQVLEVPGG